MWNFGGVLKKGRVLMPDDRLRTLLRWSTVVSNWHVRELIHYQVVHRCILLNVCRVTWSKIVKSLPTGSLGLASPPRTGIFPCKNSFSSKGTVSSGLSASLSGWLSVLNETTKFRDYFTASENLRNHIDEIPRRPGLCRAGVLS